MFVLGRLVINVLRHGQNSEEDQALEALNGCGATPGAPTEKRCDFWCLKSAATKAGHCYSRPGIAQLRRLTMPTANAPFGCTTN